MPRKTDMRAVQEAALSVGTVRVSTLARRAGIHYSTLRWHLSQTHGLSARREAIRSAGIGATELAAELGVAPSTIYRHIERGLLRARCGQALTSDFISIAAEDVSNWLVAVGGLLPLHPEATWREEFEVARVALQQRYIASQPLAVALVIPPQCLAWLRRRHAFPAPSWSLGALGTFYERRAVLAWLDTHPIYDRPGTRPAIGLGEGI